jgi:EAL domain-containing protein (putative c-di-GMP-specific phosphodiesterase class I)
VGQLSEFKQMIFRAQLKAAVQRKLSRIFINVDFILLEGMEPLDLPPGIEVVLDISEAEAVHNIARYLEVVELWRAKGYKFAIDDFGSSFISLPFVAQLFPSFIKMDRSALIQASGSERFNGFLRDMVAAMRNYSDQGIIAEGVETEEELRVVKDLGVDQVQGHLTGRPESMD